MLKTMTTDGKTVVDTHLILEQRELYIPMCNIMKGFYKINTDHSGVYRTLYSSEQLKRLGCFSITNPEFLSVEDRVGLVADSGALAQSGYSRTSEMLSLISKWFNESKFV